jgi:uncharacterized membrane protein
MPEERPTGGPDGVTDPSDGGVPPDEPVEAPRADRIGVEDLLEDLDGLGGAESDEARTEIRETKDLVAAAHERGLIESGRRELQASDAAEAFVGSVVFASPLLVEGGIFGIGDYLFTATFGGVPVFLAANTLFVVLMTHALLEWTGRNREETAMLFGRIPLRVVMILAVSFVVATALMTVWGRVSWARPTESLARINVIWTVGSLGAALGDILAGDAETTPTVAAATDHPTPKRPASRVGGDLVESEELTDSALVVALQEQFDELEAAVGNAAERREVQRLRVEAVEAAMDRALGDRIRKYTGRDIAEGFVGSIFFAVPFLVEDGVFEVAAYFLSFRLGAFPVFFMLNAVFVVLMIAALVYWAGPQDVQVYRPVFGVIPRRLVGIAVVSFLTAAALMTMWGRVGEWQEPVVALARISVVWTVAAFGAALGDILPGESSGTISTTNSARSGTGSGSPEREARSRRSESRSRGQRRGRRPRQAGAARTTCASPRKMKKPSTSVAVVMKMVADVAGSFPTRSRASGMRVPKKPAMIRFRTIDTPRTSPSSGLWLNTDAMTATRIPVMAPFAAPAITSFTMTRPPVASDTWPSASPRTVTAIDWVPAFPPIPATTGMYTASSVNAAMVSSKTPTIPAARNAVPRLMMSHRYR